MLVICELNRQVACSLACETYESSHSISCRKPPFKTAFGLKACSCDVRYLALAIASGQWLVYRYLQMRS